ncbi:thioredoxin-dependent thiol peroxidase [Prosthecobacter sp.]|uniref:thioredoxin-dependent thiol peroxidase n=1 Tax=Prosthecobacter sp. TaxID=1965333 RepID=UPI001D61E1A4|nr:thioredoxin-dependent thiol peroxidase [Prosthecobacter sp.]MCB1277865.1 thioredoxin-dependent thiol peroxidase [Prosthecobacter sp.]
MPKPALHSIAPDFTAPVVGGGHKDGDNVTLSELKGQNVVLYFYPKDDTPGCTKQACGLRDGWKAISQKALVFGVSTDSIKRHAKFILKHELPFPLIADEDHTIVNAYGVWVEKSLYGRKYMGTERSTFVIGKEGKISAILEKVKPEAHLESVLAAL